MAGRCGASEEEPEPKTAIAMGKAAMFGPGQIRHCTGRCVHDILSQSPVYSGRIPRYRWLRPVFQRSESNLHRF